MKCDLVLLAIGFVHPEHAGALEDAEVKLDVRGNIATTGFQTNRDGLFAAGDARRGQSWWCGPSPKGDAPPRPSTPGWSNHASPL